MGKLIIDQYTYAHFAIGVTIFFMGVKLRTWIIMHLLFELLSNTNEGINFIEKYTKFWTGGKTKQDSLINSMTDSLAAFLGWLSAYYINEFF